MPPNAPIKTNRFALGAVTTPFFMWGFITCLNDLLLPKFRADIARTQLQADLMQSAFFGAFFLLSLAYFLISAFEGMFELMGGRRAAWKKPDALFTIGIDRSNFGYWTHPDS